MTTLQNDLIEIYNSLTVFSKELMKDDNPVPIKVWFDKKGISSPLVFEYKGTTVRLRLPVYYCLGLESLEDPSYLLPEDYDFLMSSLQKVINDPRSLEDRTCLSPENYGFDIYSVDFREFYKGPNVIGKIKFVSGISWLFKLRIKLKYRKKW